MSSSLGLQISIFVHSSPRYISNLYELAEVQRQNRIIKFWDRIILFVLICCVVVDCERVWLTVEQSFVYCSKWIHSFTNFRFSLISIHTEMDMNREKHFISIQAKRIGWQANVPIFNVILDGSSFYITTEYHPFQHISLNSLTNWISSTKPFHSICMWICGFIKKKNSVDSCWWMSGEINFTHKWPVFKIDHDLCKFFFIILLQI